MTTNREADSPTKRETVSALEQTPRRCWYVRHPKHGMLNTDMFFRHGSETVGVVTGSTALDILEDNPGVELIRYGPGARHGDIDLTHWNDGTGAVN